MRKRFIQQNELDADLISDIELDSRSRHELPQLLAGLQYIFITPELNESVFTVLEECILKDKQPTGRLGMTFWEIFVMGVVRLNLDLNYDALYDQVNHHDVLRGILGVRTKAIFQSPKHYPIQTIKDNVALLDEDCLMRINEVIVKAGHRLKKKEAGCDLMIQFKSDSYVAESTVHFPTDFNLLWDSGRKSLDVLAQLQKQIGGIGWRKHQHWQKQLKKLYYKVANIHRLKGRDYENRLKEAVSAYLSFGHELSQQITATFEQQASFLCLNPIVTALWLSLSDYQQMLDKHLDLLHRRVIKGEKIPHEEKMFSIFERHVEWIQKGKAHRPVELGHRVLVTTDQFNFIVDHKVLVKEGEQAQAIELGLRLQKRFGKGYQLDSISFDRGFYSHLAKEKLNQIFNHVVMPNKGRPSGEQTDSWFVALQRQHSAVESNINELEHAGVNRVPDKGLRAFRRYVALGVVSYNVRRLGRVLIQQRKLSTLYDPSCCRQAA